MRTPFVLLNFAASLSFAAAFHRARDRSAPRWCPHLAQTPGPAARRDTLEFCAALTRSHQLGNSNASLVVDVGTDQATEALTARGFGHPVVTFECRGNQAHQLSLRPALFNDTGLRLVHACVSDRAGLGTLHRAADSSSMSAANVQVDGASWKARRELRQGAATESVPIMKLDNALDAASLRALGWARIIHGRIGFIKVDVQGLEESVLHGAVETLRTHKPFVFYEDSMLPHTDRKGALLERILSGGQRGRTNSQKLYACECRNDCFCIPTWASPPSA